MNLTEMENCALIIFVSNPVKGKVLPQVAKFIGAGEALKYYKSLLQNITEQTGKVQSRKFFFFTESPEGSLIEGAYSKVQQGNSPGERIKNAFNYVFDKGFAKVCIIGTNCPSLNTEIITRAFERLTDSDFVIGPAKSGGCYLLGMKKPESSLFENIDADTGGALKQAAERLKAEGRKYSALDELCDIQTIDDYIECTGIERGGSGSDKGQRFAFKLHDSLKQHYDFRLEWNGVLLSWYCEIPPSLNPSLPSLMTITCLHKTRYLYNEDNRPYFLKGPGPSIVVEHGHYTPAGGAETDTSEITRLGIETGKLEINLEGMHLKGKFSLRRRGESDRWVLQKLEDEFVSSFSLAEISHSVITGRTLDDVRSGIKTAKDVNQESMLSESEQP